MAKIYSFYKSVETDDYTFLSTILTYLLYSAKKKKKGIDFCLNSTLSLYHTSFTFFL